MTKNNIVLNGLMAVALLGTSGCWTQHGNQPGVGGHVGGSVDSSDRPIRTNNAFASGSPNDHVGGKSAQLAASAHGSD